jgi:hypothetical protein
MAALCQRAAPVRAKAFSGDYRPGFRAIFRFLAVNRRAKAAKR